MAKAWRAWSPLRAMAAGRDREGRRFLYLSCIYLGMYREKVLFSHQDSVSIFLQWPLFIRIEPP